MSGTGFPDRVGRIFGLVGVGSRSAGGVALRDVATRDRTIVEPETCSDAAGWLACAFDFLGKRWNAAVLGRLKSGPAGFREISRAIPGVSDSVLSNRLSALTAAGLITRTVDESTPISVTYALTDAGSALISALDQIAVWAQQNLPESPPACRSSGPAWPGAAAVRNSRSTLRGAPAASAA